MSLISDQAKFSIPAPTPGIRILWHILTFLFQVSLTIIWVIVMIAVLGKGLEGFIPDIYSLDSFNYGYFKTHIPLSRI